MIANLLADDSRWINAQRIEMSGGQPMHSLLGRDYVKAGERAADLLERLPRHGGQVTLDVGRLSFLISINSQDPASALAFRPLISKSAGRFCGPMASAQEAIAMLRSQVAERRG